MARICMVAYTDYHVDTRVRREAEALVKRGDSVDMVCLNDEHRPASQIDNGVRLFEISIGRYRGADIKKYLISYIWFFLTATYKLTVLQIRNRYQIVQVHTMPDFMVFVAIVPKLFGAKVILDVHDLMPELYQSKFKLSSRHPVIRFITWIERCSIRFADRAIAVHKPHLEALCSHGNPSDKFILLLNLPDTDIFSGAVDYQPTSKSGFELIYHGTVSKRHGLEVAIRAVSKLKESINGLKLTIIGDGEDITRLATLVEQLDIQDLVQINQGIVPLVELVYLIRGADVGVVPILYDDFTKYMLPTKLLEYAYLGIPTICSRTETIQAYFDETMVQYFSPGCVSELAESILSLYQNPERRLELSKNAKKFNEQFNWEKQKLTYYQLIDELIGRKSIP